MLEIEGKIISLEVLEMKFCCNMQECTGTCCVQGDYGAPLEEGEAEQIKEFFPVFKKYMPRRSVSVVKRSGFSVPDIENVQTTPLIKGGECAYAYFEGKTVRCAIEKAYFDDKIPFRKPISCHLYPIRVKKYREFEAVNFHNWHVCYSAHRYGEENNIRLIDFLKEALVRKYGHNWYDMLVYAAENFLEE